MAGGAGQVTSPELQRALRALRIFRLTEESHYAWIVGGAKTLTEAEHLQRFGVPYVKAKPKRGARAA